MGTFLIIRQKWVVENQLSISMLLKSMQVTIIYQLLMKDCHAKYVLIN